MDFLKLAMAVLVSMALIPDQVSADAACPGANAVASDWIRYLGEQSSQIHSSTDYGPISECFQNNQAAIVKLGVDDCTNRLASYSLRRATMKKDHQMGLTMTDQEYDRTRPAFTHLPSEFKNGLPENWKALAQKKGWPYLIYESRTVPNPPHDSMGRLLFLIKKDGHEQWVQFTYPDIVKDGKVLHQTMIDTLTIEDAGGKPKIHFRQYERDGNGKNPILRTEHTAKSGGEMDQCYKCHPNAMREIKPLDQSLVPVAAVEGDSEKVKAMGDAERARYRLEEFNQRMRDYGQVSWGDTLDTSALGPPFGGSQCVSCHNQESRSPLTLETSMQHIEHKIQVEKSMPPGATLTDAERFKLVMDLQRQYKKEVAKWFVPAECRPPLGEEKCQNPLKNRSIAQILRGQEELRVETIIKALQGKRKQYAALIAYARHCDLSKIAEGERSAKDSAARRLAPKKSTLEK